jgi:hypothetical protein
MTYPQIIIEEDEEEQLEHHHLIIEDGLAEKRPANGTVMDYCFSLLENLDATRRKGMTWYSAQSSSEKTGLSRHAKSLLLLLLPSFIFASEREKLRNRGKSPTAWVDGLRGIAAYIVSIHHYVLPFFVDHFHGYAPPQHPYIVNLPFIRLFSAGDPMVSIFFAISGFALTYKTVKYLHQKRPLPYQQLHQSLSSSVARRYLRLFLPCFANYVVLGMMRFFGFYDSIVQTPGNRLPGRKLLFPPKGTSFLNQLYLIVTEFRVLAIDVTVFGQRGYRYETNVSRVL